MNTLNGKEQWLLVTATSVADVAALEQQFSTTREEVVDDLIEDSCWSSAPRIRTLVGGKGGSEQRLEALRMAKLEEGLECA